MSFEKVWFMVPYHIRKLPGMTLALLDFYETIFEFWNNGKSCFLSNAALMERTGIKSLTTIREAFQYFEKHGVMKRLNKPDGRYIAQILKAKIEDVENEPVDNNAKNDPTPLSGVGGGGTSGVGGGGTSGVGGISNKFNNKKLNKSFCVSRSEKQKEESFKKPDFPKPNEMRCTSKFWGPGHPDYDRLNPISERMNEQ